MLLTVMSSPGNRVRRLQAAHVAAIFEAIDELNEMILAARAGGEAALGEKVKGRRLVNAATKQRIRATLRSALNTAIRQRLIDINPAALIELPPGKRPKALVWTPERITAWRTARDTYVAGMRERKKVLAATSPHGAKLGTGVTAYNAYVATPRPSPVMVWTPDQTTAFLQRAKGHRLYALYHLITFRGLRRGEGCGLRWPDLDLADGQMSIGWQIIQVGGTTTQGRPKSDAGQRHVALDKHTVRELLAHKARPNSERLAAGAAWADSVFVFTTVTGEPLDPADSPSNSTGCAWKPTCPRSACTTCATAPQRSCLPPGTT